MQILKYGKTNTYSTNLSVLDELLLFWECFNSEEYVNKILLEKYAITRKNDRKKLFQKIKTHNTHALELAKQALSSSTNTSFIPYYYSCLNFAIVYLLFNNKGKELESQHGHGAKYSHAFSKKDDPLNEKIKILTKGTIPLLHSTLTDFKFIKDITPVLNKKNGHVRFIPKLGLHKIQKHVHSKHKSFCTVIAIDRTQFI